MYKSFLHLFRLALLACALWLTACTPRYDWRVVRGDSAPFTVLMPAKPSVQARPVTLNGVAAMMTMTTAEVDDLTFAVGVIELPDTMAAPAALTAIRTALVNNIGGVLRSEKTLANGAIEIEAAGKPEGAGSQSRLLLARLVAKDRRIYQIVAVGQESTIDRDAAGMFLDSFKF